MKNDLESVQKIIAYRFNDPSRLDQALTHRSVSGRNNERLEFLGDAVLAFVIAAELFDRHPQSSEGDMSRLRANLVKGKTLAELARQLSLGQFLRLGAGEMKSGGFRRDSILAGALEAVIGAIYLDGGIDPCRRFILELYAPVLESASPEMIRKDPKTRLQELLQSQRQALPLYTVVDISGCEHAQTFTVECTVSGLNEPVTGTGSSRRQAEQDAAARALSLLSDSTDD